MTIASDISREELIKKVDIGSTVHVTSEPGEIKYRANLVGYSSGVIITSLPTAKQMVKPEKDHEKLFPSGMLMILRLIVHGVIYAFKSQVHGVNLDYCKILLSSLPEKIQIRHLRARVRYPCVLQAGLIIGETKYRGVLTNISEGGCQLRMKIHVNIDTLKAMKENNKITSMDIRFPFEDQDNTFKVKIKSIVDSSAGYVLLGLSYKEIGNVADIIKKYLEFMQLEELSEYLQLS